jgi:hypothetical protein
VKEIQLTQNKVALVDDEDFDRLNKHKWYSSKLRNCWYAWRHLGKHSTIKMHREVLLLVKNDKKQIDHINCNGLDNRKENLRLCNYSENQQNRIKIKGISKYKGVDFSKKRNKWRVRINKDYKIYNLGEFTNEIDAAYAYDIHAMWLFGDFARLNFPLVERVA